MVLYYAMIAFELVFYDGGGFATAITAETGTITNHDRDRRRDHDRDHDDAVNSPPGFSGLGPVQTGRAR
jgi:hypothetical protein